ncbi:hypothetical protein CC80DRAFT_501380 [Byssothecium circinans]|uniref:BTB domain-containing protein n=1 Tax=Byssothecium circinans TaxID=147558 RepID=A0A6A5UB43_9PLEO|nr:hypothetical protein CC80DRAFT_501380 [Byssothecium circinans]
MASAAAAANIQPHPPLHNIIARLNRIENVTVKVGRAPHTQDTTYTVHKAFLTHYSEFFMGALQRSRKEAGDQTVTLEDVEPAVFNIFIECIHNACRRPENFGSR